MLLLLLIFIFLVVAGVLWLQGFWSNVITAINFLLAAMLAFNYFEPIAAKLSISNAGYAYVWDVVVFWMLFAFGFGMLRLFTDLLSRSRVKFHIGVEMAGRTIMALWIAWMFVGLVCVSFHIGPVKPHALGSFQKGPNSSNFLGFSPGRQWFAYMQSRSRGALSRGSDAAPANPKDEGRRVFDPRSEYIIKYYHRRLNLDNQ